MYIKLSHNTPLFLFLVISCLYITACSKKTENLNQAIKTSMNLENTNSENEQSQSKIQKNKSKSKVDYDLTKMNYNLITSLLFDMAVEPEKYIGKSVRFSGEFFTDYNQMFKTRLFSCVIYDATLCCQAGIGFICNNLTYPKDFPKEKDTITIEGTFCLRDYDGISYSYLDCNEIISE